MSEFTFNYERFEETRPIFEGLPRKSGKSVNLDLRSEVSFIYSGIILFTYSPLFPKFKLFFETFSKLKNVTKDLLLDS